MNFVNFEDPEVLERLTGPEYEKHWKETYGFDYVTKPAESSIYVDKAANVTKIDITPLAMHCVESEYR